MYGFFVCVWLTYLLLLHGIFFFLLFDYVVFFPPAKTPIYPGSSLLRALSSSQ